MRTVARSLSVMVPTVDEIARSNVRVWELLVGAMPGGWLRREGGALGVVTGVGLGGFNGVWGELRDVDPSAVARLLDSVREAGVPHCLQLRPGWPPEVDQIAQERGLVRVAGEPLMVRGHDPQLAAALSVEGLSLRPLTPEEAALHAHVVAGGQVVQHEDPYSKVASPAVLRTPGVRCYVGEVGGKAVTTALSVTTDHCVGVFSVATLPEHRRRGYGAAVTARAVCDGFDRGSRWAWLTASEPGYPVYRDLGFLTVERLDFWESVRS